VECARIVFVFVQEMDVRLAGLWDQILQAIAGMDGTSCGREGVAAVAKQQQRQSHVFCQLVEQYRRADFLLTNDSIWPKLINEHKVRVQPRFMAQRTMQHAAAKL